MRVSKPQSGSNGSANPTGGSDFSQQLTQVFSSNDCISMESEQTGIAKLENVMQWITSKTPLGLASKAHIFKTEMQSKVMVCVFFADVNGETLIGDEYPMKRIICDGCDSDMEAFLNGLPIGTIILKQQ